MGNVAWKMGFKNPPSGIVEVLTHPSLKQYVPGSQLNSWVLCNCFVHPSLLTLIIHDNTLQNFTKWGHYFQSPLQVSWTRLSSFRQRKSSRYVHVTETQVKLALVDQTAPILCKLSGQTWLFFTTSTHSTSNECKICKAQEDWVWTQFQAYPDS